MNETELKLCPFCRGSAEWEYTPWNEDTETGDDGSGKIECNGCHAVMQAGSRDEAEAKWNTRAALAAAPEQPVPLDAVVKMLEKKAADYANEFGQEDLGSLSFGSGSHSQVKMDHYTGLLELADEIRAMPTQPHTHPAPEQPVDEKDAQRYRLLKRGQHWSVIDGVGNTLRAEVLDTAVDAAIAVQQGGGK